MTCAQKPTQVTLIYRREPTTKKWKTGKLKSKKTNMLRSIGKQFGKSIMVSPEEEKEGYGGEGLQKMKFFKPGMKD